MIELLYSNRMDALLPALDAGIQAERRAHGPWQPIRIIVPNQATAWCIERYLIQSQGIAANLDFGFMGNLIQAFLPEGAALIDRPAIQGVLLRRFRSGAGLEGAAFAQIHSYLQSPLDPKRLAQLSFRLAGLLEEYLFSRPAWAGAWEAAADPAGLATMEACQRGLWRLVRADLKAAAIRWLTPVEALPLLAAPEAPGSAHLFGMSHLAYGYHMLLDAIGRLAPASLTCYALNPCREFWEDHPTQREADRLAARRGLQAFEPSGNPEAEGAGDGDQEQEQEHGQEQEEDPYGLQAPGESAPLRHWGRAGREKIRVLNELADWSFMELFLDPGRDTQLAALQQDILLRTTSDLGPAGDGSIQVHACANPHREAETICDLLWDLFRESLATGAPLGYGDVAILVPAGQLETYAAHLGSALGEPPGIPLSVLAGQATPLHEAVEAFRTLLALPDGPLSRAEILGFLDRPAVRRGLGDAYAETWRTWCQATGIVRGKDREDLQPTYFEGDLLNWDQGHRRLALGAFLGADQPPLAQDGEDYPPLELGSGEWVSAGTFIQRTRALLAELRALPGETGLTLADWVDRFSLLAAQWLGGPLPEHQAALDRLQQGLARMGTLEAAPEAPAPQAFGCARELALQELERLDVSRAATRFHGVVLADPASLRGIPFRIVILAGLAEGEFPAKDGVDDLDLRVHRRLPGDVSASERDRFLFLEALLAARDRFILTYVDRHPVSGDPLEPSPVVTELLDLIDPLAGPAPKRSLPRRHPLRRWHRPRFAEACRPWPAQAAAYLEAMAEARYRGAEPPTGPEDPALGPLPRWPAPARGGARIRLRLTRIRNFLVSPLQGWGEAVLGLERDEGDPDRMAEEAASSEKKDVTILLREAFWSAQGTGVALEAAYAAGRRSRERAGVVPLGLFSEPEIREHLALLNTWRERLAQDLPVAFPSLGAASHAQAGGEPAPPLALDLRLDGAATPVELTGNLSPQGDLGEGQGSILLLARSVHAAADAPRDSLLAWLDHLVLAAQAAAPRAHRAYLVGAGPASAPLCVLHFAAITPQEASERLAAILERLLGHDHAYLLPIAAVLDREAVPDGAALAAWVDANRYGEHSQLSCKYGPVPHPETFPAATEADLDTWRELLGPFLAALGGQS